MFNFSISDPIIGYRPVTNSLVAVNTALHLGVGLDAPHEVACGSEERYVKVLHRLQKRLRHRRLDQTLHAIQSEKSHDM